MKTISARRLERAGACAGQVEMFLKIFGDGRIPLTPENWEKARPLDRFWMVHFLEGEVLTEYRRVDTAALNEYWRIHDTTYSRYPIHTEQTVRECREITGPAWLEYEQIWSNALLESLLKS